MKKIFMNALSNEELAKINGGVAPDKDGKSCTEHGLEKFLHPFDPITPSFPFPIN